MKRAILVAGLGFGDEGKGSVVDALVRRTGAKLVVRYNGGAQAAHHVVGRVVGAPGDLTVEHCCAQVGAGVLAGADTYLSAFVKVDPIALRNELNVLRQKGIKPNVYIDESAPLLTPWHRALNRLRESSRGSRHGSCGMGIGELGEDLAEGRPVLRVSDLGWSISSLEKTEVVRTLKRLQAQRLWNDAPLNEQTAALWSLIHTPASEWLAAAKDAVLNVPRVRSFRDVAQDRETVVFEGAQGVLLDEWMGFHPFTTWSDCTFANADAIIRSFDTSNSAITTRVGVLRAFHTRHGAGPFPTEAGAGEPGWRSGEHNDTGPWQGLMRYGYFDAVLARYAMDASGGINTLALTCLDRLSPFTTFKYCDAYTHPEWDGPMRRMDVPDSRDRDLAKQAEVAASLRRISPQYLATPGPDALEAVQTALGCEVGITSHGPDAERKTFRGVHV